jgi:hypothetical protein
VSSKAPGRIRLGVLLFILVVVAGVYLATKFVPPYWTYLSMQDPIKEAAMTAVTAAGEARARADLISRAQEQGLTLSEDNIEFRREGPVLVVRVAWVASVELPSYRYTIPFLVEERVRLR